MPDKILFKRYSNRRLYDTSTSSYVTLDGVAEIIRKGSLVEVVDADTGEDITAYTLTQILLEEARKKNVLMPAPLLHLAIRYGDGVLAEFFEKYLREVVANYVSYQNMAGEQFRKWLGMGLDFSEMARETVGKITPVTTYVDALLGSGGKGDRKE